jgi:hypothetical protein
MSPLLPSKDCGGTGINFITSDRIKLEDSSHVSVLSLETEASRPISVHDSLWTVINAHDDCNIETPRTTCKIDFFKPNINGSGSRDSSVGIATGYRLEIGGGAGVRVPVG